MGYVGIRPWIWTLVCLAVLTCAATYRLTMWSPSSEQSPVVAHKSEPQPVDQNSEPILSKHEAGLQNEPGLEKEPDLEKERSTAKAVEPSELPVVQEQAAVQQTPDTDIRELAA